jgi:phosphoglycerate dehydrogenase-like enzyme
MLDKTNLCRLKEGAILVGATWGVINLEDLLPLLRSKRIAFGFDVAVEGSEIALPGELLALDNVVVTPHIAFNTSEAKVRQVDTCISNIEAFKEGVPTNVVN